LGRAASNAQVGEKDLKKIFYRVTLVTSRSVTGYAPGERPASKTVPEFS
jgi:hypothetical protein